MVLAFRRRSGFLAVFILAGISAIESQQSGIAPDLRKSSPPRVVKPVGQEEVKLVCNVKYAKNYTWYKNHKKIHQPADRYVVKTPRYLRITDVLKSDSGTFVCIASNKYGTVNCTIRLNVEDPTVSSTNVSGAVKPHFLYPDKMAEAKSEYTEGEKFQLLCDAKGTPTPTVTWYREHIRSLPQILSIWGQKKPEYAGTDLQMRAIVLSKNINTKFFWYFSKRFVPDETNLGTLINQTLFESRLETPPPPSSVSWLKWKVVLNLKNLSVADSGSYWCQAENILGTVQRQTSLKVTTRPITPSPSGSTVSLTSISFESEAVTQTSMGWTDRIRYPVAVIAVPVGVVVLLIIASGLFYWQVKKGRASSSATMKSRHNIGSLQAKYVVQSNEYVIVPDLKGLGNDFGTN
nr:hemicentin-2-like isoform X2 [Pocillopora verrucosa]